MYLKSIEIQGFKSFPDNTVINLSRGVTAIVGPNGSGKSNIVDAVKWVLGEQSSKNLRGGKMEDVIFGGTVKRPPSSYSKVSLTIDNSERLLPIDYGEVTVTRRYGRNGDSEFFINRKSVRLKDIHELSSLIIFSRSHPVLRLTPHERECLLEYYRLVKAKVADIEAQCAGL